MRHLIARAFQSLNARKKLQLLLLILVLLCSLLAAIYSCWPSVCSGLSLRPSSRKVSSLKACQGSGFEKCSLLGQLSQSMWPVYVLRPESTPSWRNYFAWYGLFGLRRSSSIAVSHVLQRGRELSAVDPEQICGPTSR